MDEFYFGIYGFEFARSMTVADISMTPLFSRQEAERRAADKTALCLTGYGRIPATSSHGWVEKEKIDLLGAGMTFAQQQHVAVSRPVTLSEGDSIDRLFADDRLGRPFYLLGTRSSFGPVIATDSWSPNSRQTFLELFLSRFGRDVPDDALRKGFFRQLEISRLSTAFVELQHFLAFSGLELIARSEGVRAASRNAAEPIVDLLNASGFVATQAEIETWTHARNAAFHRGELVSKNHQGLEIRLAEQLFSITRVLCDVLLKKLDFDDGHINWNRWRDAMPFC